MEAVATSRSPFSGIRLRWRVTPLRLAIGLTSLALSLRLIDLGSRPLWLDEAFSAWFSDRSFHYLWSVLPTYEAHPPFYYSVLKLWRSLAGEGHAAMRGLSVLFGALTVPAIMALAFEQERQSPTGRGLLRAGLAGFLAACSPMLIVVGQEARPYPMLGFAYSIAILALLRLMREIKAGNPGSWSAWILLAAATELTLWSHALGILYGMCLALALLPVWLSARPSRARLMRGLAAGAAVAAVYLPCLIMMTARAHDWSTNWLEWQPSMLLQLLVLYTVPVEALTVGSAVAALAMALLIKRAVATTWVSKGWNTDRAMLLLWLGPPMLAALISATFEPVFLARTLSGTLVPAYLAIATAIARTEQFRERRMITAAICITLLPTAFALSVRTATERWDLLASYLSHNVASGDQVWLYPADSELPLAQEGAHIPGTVRAIPARFPTLGVDGPIRAGWPAVVSVTRRQADTLVTDPALKRVPRIWLVTRQSGIFDPDNDMPKALSTVRQAGPRQEWGYITVQPYYTAAASN
jgi:mannosyltransferase